MDISENKKHVTAFKKALEEAPTVENGWELVSDEPVSKKFSDSHIKIYKKKTEGDSLFTTRVEGTISNVELDKFFRMMTDVTTMQKGNTPIKEIKIVEKLSNNDDVIYFEINLPFPMSNRDLLQKRLYLGNKEDAALVKELGLYDWSHKYYIFLGYSIERADVPPKKDVVRGNAKMNYWIIEEDPQSWKKIKIRQVSCQDMGGNIPTSFANKFGVKGAKKRVKTLLENYGKIYNS